ncbi:MAG: amylo-alpha-1,6-glucosidase [Prevotellaceae bacterium]|nr:amylo-alpha-1,6-glucosidase [Prevotellaceae bacterium]
MKQAKWIWYPGDFEMWLGNRFNNLRSERGAMSPTFWKQDSHYPMVEFSTKVSLTDDETIEVFAEGDYNVAIDGVKVFGMPRKVTVPKGCHAINIKVVNQPIPPLLFVRGTTIVSDSSWLATFEDKIWIDENGVAHGSGVYVPAASWKFDSPDCPPSKFSLERKPQSAVSVEQGLYDFGRETMGYLNLEGISGEGEITICYGESREEALDEDFCETLDKISIGETAENWETIDLGHNLAEKVKREAESEFNYTLAFSKAFRYVNIITSGSVKVGNLSMQYEYLPLEYRGTFRCNDEQLNKIWDVGAYTLQLTTREFFMDGIKRDRWVWSGDAVQSFLMNYYLFFDSDCVKRTIRLLRGKDPVTAHINTIMDYTFYWFNGIYDFYLYSGDKAFVEEMYPKMKTLMAYCLGRTDENGMAEGQPDDWIFVDWVDFPMHKRGVMCFEQILFCKSLETMALCANLCSKSIEANQYNELAGKLKATFTETFWDSARHAFLHNLEDGQINTMVTKFPNMFAIIYGYADEARKKEILDHVMLNPEVEAITTPYMRFYELEALCLMGMQDDVLREMKSYWGGMLDEGATSFWEKYIPSESGTQHLAMYGRPYGKSLCHAWGASPVYLLGKYYLGVRPTKPGFEEYEVRPVLGGLEWMEGDVPTPFGKIHVRVSKDEVSVYSDGGNGTLYIYNKEINIKPKTETIIKL